MTNCSHYNNNLKKIQTCDAWFAPGLLSMIRVLSSQIRGVFLISSLSIFIIFLLLAHDPATWLIEIEFSSPAKTIIRFYIIIDSIRFLMSAVVLFISSNVLIFSTFYINEDKYKHRFTLLVLSFILSINILIFFPHFIILLLGWDGLGITSFLLVIYYQSPKALSAGIITALTNRIGDVLILTALGLCLAQNHWNILLIWNTRLNSLLVLIILIAAITKRAQIPFSRWLPAAIAAPTPVSALVHSSTLVTAGVFILIRFFPLLKISQRFLFLLGIISLITTIMASLAAIVEQDLKKIIALSTLSQLGVIIIALALKMPTLALFHLITHALFKALLFLCAGNLIHYNSHSQDLRTTGSNFYNIPLTARAFLLASLSLCGFPFLTAFYSKDLILETRMFINLNPLITVIFSLTTVITAAYSRRFLFLGWTTFSHHSPLHINKEADFISYSPTFILSCAALTGGATINWVYTLPINEPILTPIIKTSPLIFSLLGVILSLIFLINKRVTLTTPKYHLFSSSIWLLSPLSTQGIIKSPRTCAKLYLQFDQTWLEILGGQGLWNSLITFSKRGQISQNKPIPRILIFSALLFPLIFISM